MTVTSVAETSLPPAGVPSSTRFRIRPAAMTREDLYLFQQAKCWLRDHVVQPLSQGDSQEAKNAINFYVSEGSELCPDSRSHFLDAHFYEREEFENICGRSDPLGHDDHLRFNGTNSLCDRRPCFHYINNSLVFLLYLEVAGIGLGNEELAKRRNMNDVTSRHPSKVETQEKIFPLGEGGDIIALWRLLQYGLIAPSKFLLELAGQGWMPQRKRPELERGAAARVFETLFEYVKTCITRRRQKVRGLRMVAKKLVETFRDMSSDRVVTNLKPKAALIPFVQRGSTNKLNKLLEEVKTGEVEDVLEESEVDEDQVSSVPSEERLPSPIEGAQRGCLHFLAAPMQEDHVVVYPDISIAEFEPLAGRLTAVPEQVYEGSM